MGEKTELEQAADDACAALREVATSGLLPEFRAGARIGILVIVGIKTLVPMFIRLAELKAKEEADA